LAGGDKMDEENRLIFYLDALVLMQTNVKPKSTRPSPEGGILRTIRVPQNSSQHVVWYKNEQVERVDFRKGAYEIQAFQDGNVRTFKGRLLSVEREQLTFLGADLQNKSAENVQHRLYSQDYLLKMASFSQLAFEVDTTDADPRVAVVMHIPSVSWSFRHVLRLHLDRAANLDTSVTFDPLEFEHQTNLELKEIMFKRHDLSATRQVRSQRRYFAGGPELAARASSSRDEERDATVSSTGEWSVTNVALDRGNTTTLRVSRFDFPVVYSLVYTVRTESETRKGNPEVWLDMSNKECQTVLQSIEEGPMTLFAANGTLTSEGIQINTQTKRIMVTEATGVVIEVERIDDNLKFKYHDEEVKIVNKSDAPVTLSLWHMSASAVEINPDKANKSHTEAELDVELRTRIVKVTLVNPSGLSTWVYRWFDS
jgi:hypothetical protein